MGARLPSRPVRRSDRKSSQGKFNRLGPGPGISWTDTPYAPLRKLVGRYQGVTGAGR
jgi:hypothetical protein